MKQGCTYCFGLDMLVYDEMIDEVVIEPCPKCNPVRAGGDAEQAKEKAIQAILAHVAGRKEVRK